MQVRDVRNGVYLRVEGIGDINVKEVKVLNEYEAVVLYRDRKDGREKSCIITERRGVANFRP